MLEEFKKFLIKGNMIDMAVGFIFGAAFATLVKSLVANVIMPPVGMLMGRVDFSQLFFALDGIASFSIVPLRIITVVGFIIFILSFFIILWIMFEKFFLGTTIKGWSSVMISIYFMGGIQVMSIGIIGEYIGRIFQQSKRRPRYIIDREI